MSRLLHVSAPVALLAMVSLGATTPPSLAQSAPITATASADFDGLMRDLSAAVLARADAGVPVPQPVDAGGGYSHEQHKQNGKTIYEAGLLFAHTGDQRYRDIARDILLDYAELYPTLGLHPEQGNQAPGRLFWQSLNEAVWLVYAIQGYEQIRPSLSEAERESIESRVFVPMATFLSEESPQTFDRIHNHGIWACAAVGMTGYVLGNSQWVEQALYGLDRSGESGFLRQLEMLFSPDGYYAEGPYYQRYALMPVVLFAQAIERNEPEREIFSFRDGIVLKAIRATVEQSYAGRFFPINDAIREKGLDTVELKYALAIAYAVTGEQQYVGAAAMQNGVVPTPEGRALLEAMQRGDAEPFQFSTLLLRDGPDGDMGGLAILRSGPGPGDAAAILKATSQGLGHGHFDRLGFLYYDNGEEVVADYGAARFLNVEPKDGGRYLPENDSWAQQSIAHNTLVVDQHSHFGGDWRVAQEHAPEIIAFDTIDGVQIAYAQSTAAYDGVTMQRLIALAPRPNGETAVIDIMRGASAGAHTYDLPVHFNGQFVESSLNFEMATDTLAPLGEANGYQHLWRRGEASPADGLQFATWLLNNRFYSLSVASNAPIGAFFAELGANDPNSNLRREQALILRGQADSIEFVSVYEKHGLYDATEEVTVYDGPGVASIDLGRSGATAQYSIHFDDGQTLTLLLPDNLSERRGHSVRLSGHRVSWTGPVHVVNNTQTAGDAP